MEVSFLVFPQCSMDWPTSTISSIGFWGRITLTLNCCLLRWGTGLQQVSTRLRITKKCLQDSCLCANKIMFSRTFESLVVFTHNSCLYIYKNNPFLSLFITASIKRYMYGANCKNCSTKLYTSTFALSLSL